MITLEIINCVLTILSVYLLSKGNKYGWLLSIIVCLTMAYIYYEKKLWYQCGIQFIFLLQSITAYFEWSKWVEQKIIKLSIIYVTIGYFLMTSFFLYSVKHDLLSYTDLLLMFISFVANHLLIIKNKYSWYLWLIYDLISIVLCLHLQLYITVFLFVVLTIICLKTVIENKFEYEKI